LAIWKVFCAFLQKKSLIPSAVFYNNRNFDPSIVGMMPQHSVHFLRAFDSYLFDGISYFLKESVMPFVSKLLSSKVVFLKKIYIVFLYQNLFVF